MRLTRKQGRTSYSVEDVLRSQTAAKGRGGVPLGSTYTPGVAEAGLQFYWQHRPTSALRPVPNLVLSSRMLSERALPLPAHSMCRSRAWP